MSTLYHLIVSPVKGHYNEQWFAAVLRFVRQYSSKFICSEESGNADEPVSHIDCALWINPSDVQAMKKAYQRATSQFPAESKSNRTKQMKPNPNAEKYASKEDHHKVYEGYTDSDIARFQSEYFEEVAMRDSNRVPQQLARKLAIAIINNDADWRDTLERPLVQVAAVAVYMNLISTKEFGKIQKMSSVVRLNMEDMKTKWSEFCRTVESEIRREHQLKADQETLQKERQRDIAITEHRKVCPKTIGKSWLCTQCYVISHQYAPATVDMQKVQEEAHARVESTDAASIL